MLIASRTIEIDHNDQKSILLGVTQGSLAFYVFPACFFIGGAKAVLKTQWQTPWPALCMSIPMIKTETRADHERGF